MAIDRDGPLGHRGGVFAWVGAAVVAVLCARFAWRKAGSFYDVGLAAFLGGWLALGLLSVVRFAG